MREVLVDARTRACELSEHRGTHLEHLRTGTARLSHAVVVPLQLPFSTKSCDPGSESLILGAAEISSSCSFGALWSGLAPHRSPRQTVTIPHSRDPTLRGRRARRESYTTRFSHPCAAHTSGMCPRLYRRSANGCRRTSPGTAVETSSQPPPSSA